jgi:hypothetical protein
MYVYNPLLLISTSSFKLEVFQNIWTVDCRLINNNNNNNNNNDNDNNNNNNDH